MTTYDDEFTEKFLKPIVDNDAKLRQRETRKLPTGKEAGIEWDGNEGELRTGPTSGAPSDWSGLLEKWGLDPEEVEIVGDVRRSSWEAQTPDGIQELSSYRAHIRRRSFRGDLDLEVLFDEIKKHKPRKTKKSYTGDLAYLHCTSDTQIGKDDPRWAWERFSRGIDEGTARLQELRKIGRPVGDVYLPWNGDCIEATAGHYPSQTFNVSLTITEQVRLFRRFMLAQIKAYAPLTDNLIVTSVPGNHDEASRVNGKQSTKNSDSWSIEVAAQVAEILAENPDVYGHVSIVVPKNQDLTISLNIAGVPVGLAHGHQFKSGAEGWRTWWANQAHGCQEIGQTKILIAGHKHHWMSKTEGEKSFIQLPAEDGGSQWYVDGSGQDSKSAIVTLTVGEDHPDGWGNLHMIY
jgi:hypothetical protein